MACICIAYLECTFSQVRALDHNVPALPPQAYLLWKELTNKPVLKRLRHKQSDGKFADGIIAGFVLLVTVVVS